MYYTRSEIKALGDKLDAKIKESRSYIGVINRIVLDLDIEIEQLTIEYAQALMVHC